MPKGVFSRLRKGQTISSVLDENARLRRELADVRRDLVVERLHAAELELKLADQKYKNAQLEKEKTFKS
jgi:hypothetical protein